MDFITQQFIALLHKLEMGISHLHEAIDKHKSSIENATRANQQESQPLKVNAELYLPKEIEQALAKKCNEGRGWEKANVIVSGFTALFTLFAFVAAAVYAHYAHQTLVEMRNQTPQLTASAQAAGNAAGAAIQANTDAAKRFIQDERPYIWLLNQSFDPPRIEQEGKYAGHLSVQYHFMNYGRTPAVNERGGGYIAIGDNECRDLYAEPIPTKYGSFIPIGQQDVLNVLYSKKSVSKDELTLIEQGKIPVCIFGYFEYSDMAGTVPEYTGEFCRMPGIDMSTFSRPTYCKPHNWTK